MRKLAHSTTAPATHTIAAYTSLNDWRPTTQITLRSFTPEEAQQLITAALENSRPESAQDIPIPSPKAELDGLDRYAAIAQCMTEAGFPAEVDPAGDYRGKSFPDSQKPLFDKANWVCGAQYPLLPGYYTEYTSDQLNVVYEYWTGFYLPCAEAHGLPIDTSQIPTRESFVSDWFKGQQWSPNTMFMGTQEASKLTDSRTAIGQQFYKDCPIDPPYHYLFN